MTECAIEAVELRKSFKGHEALCGLNLNVPRGSVFGFLGRNGAGKTTTIRILMGLAKADRGEARIFGIAPGDDNSGALLRRRIGFVPEDKELYPYMTVEQVIGFSRPFFPHWRDDLERRYLNAFDLPPKKKIPDLSKGMRSKLMLLLAIARGSELLVLDEPTDGLDPVMAEELLRELIRLSASDGTTIFFSSHQLAEVEQVADRITIINQGRSIVSGELEDLKRQYQRIKVVFADGIPAAIPWAQGADRIRKEGRMVSILFKHVVAAFCCVTAMYSLGVFFASFLDEVYQHWATIFTVVGTIAILSRVPLPASMDALLVLSLASPLNTHTMPWIAMAVLLGLSGMLLLIALKIVRSLEY